MHHTDIFNIVETATDKVLAVATVALEPDTTSAYAYYLRTADGKYTMMLSLIGMSVKEVYDWEHHKMRDAVQKVLLAARPDIQESDWEFARTTNSDWDEARNAAPEVTASNWLEAQESEFVDD